MAGLEEGPSKVYVVFLSEPHLTGGFCLHPLTLSSVELLLLVLLLVLTPRSGSNDGQTLLGGTLRPDACRESVYEDGGCGTHAATIQRRRRWCGVERWVTRWIRNILTP